MGLSRNCTKENSDDAYRRTARIRRKCNHGNYSELSHSSRWPPISQATQSDLLVEEEVEKALIGMYKSWTSSNEGITAEINNYAGRQIRKILAHIYPTCLKTRGKPQNWKNANIIPTHGKGSKEDIRHYRPIILLPGVYKIFRKIFYTRIQNTPDTAQSREWGGFTKGFTSKH